MDIINNSLNLSKVEFPVESIKNIGFRSYSPGWIFNRNGTTDTFYYIASGSLVLCLKDSTLNLKKGTMFRMAKNEFATMKNISEHMCSIYYITFNLKEDITFDSLNINRIYEDKNGAFESFFKDINNSAILKDPCHKIKEFYLFSKLIYKIMTAGLKERTPDTKTYLAINYIHTNIKESITADTLCAITGYSPSHLRRLFIKNYGMPPGQYILKARINLAKDILLERPDMSVEEVSECVGMCSGAYFCKVFKERTGISPYKFRQLPPE